MAKAARIRGIDKLVVADHNAIWAAQQAQKLDPDLFIVGEEILTTKGEILAVFVLERIPPLLTPRETISILREQGAFISVSHPFDLHRHGWQPDDLGEIAALVDAVEVFNARCFSKKYNEQALDFARDNHLAGTAGSDAHTIREIGQAALRLPTFSNTAELKRSISEGIVIGRRSSFWVRFGSMYARLSRKIKRPNP
jgi:hypothetical protein